MPLTEKGVSAAIALQLREFRFPAALEALKPQLIEPAREDRVWEHGAPEQLIECWLIAQLQDDIGIAYSLEGYGPSKPWGVVYTDTKDHCGPSFCWHSRLDDAFIGAGQWDGPLPDGYEWA